MANRISDRIDREMLDSLVHRQKAKEADLINKLGIEVQLVFLLQHYAAEDLRLMFEPALGLASNSEVLTVLERAAAMVGKTDEVHIAIEQARKGGNFDGRGG